MKNIRKYLILTLAAIIISSSMLVAADTGTNQNSSIKSYKVINSTGFEPHTLDFQTSSSVAEVEVSSKVMEGLMRRNGQDIIPGIASRYEVSKDGLTYTFYLRDALWSDGKPVTAYDFAYAWKRALDPKVASEYAFLMYYIKNAELFNNGKIAESQLGIKVLNNKTLQVVLENPTPYFIDLTTTMTYMPAIKDLIDKYKEKYFNGSMPLVVNGPFKL
ncbi:MAG: extracellular solute-binding protein family 5, partial [Clostridia bacterium]|nr:extracellular solute-binding protein family 5 [Clostridia bacterium]